MTEGLSRCCPDCGLVFNPPYLRCPICFQATAEYPIRAQSSGPFWVGMLVLAGVLALVAGSYLYNN